jgi:hypothetical protein
MQFKSMHSGVCNGINVAKMQTLKNAFLFFPKYFFTMMGECQDRGTVVSTQIPLSVN